MERKDRAYVAIDLKSFYASVECVERGLDPLTTHLVVADETRTEKTICLAVSPSLKALGVPGRPRLFEVIQQVERINERRRRYAPGREFTGSSYDAMRLRQSPECSIAYLTAVPRMALYMEHSARIYGIYLKYVAPEDIHVYSIDEVFLDVAGYLKAAGQTVREFTKTILRDILRTTGITATAGIGTNLYLCKVAMDIVAKSIEPDEDGARIAQLDERSYRELLWDHRPLTDFWRVGKGYARKLEQRGLFTMGDIARCSIGGARDIHNEESLYRLFGVNAELLIDHAWGWEPCTMADIKAYKPKSNSLGSGQVLHEPYSFEKGKLIVKEMADSLVLELVEKGLVTDQMTLTVGYDQGNLKNPKIRKQYKGSISIDRYGRSRPKHAHGTTNLKKPTSSTKWILDAVLELYEEIVDQNLLIRRVTITANHVVKEHEAQERPSEQLDMFTDYAAMRDLEKEEKQELAREKETQKAMLDIKRKFGKNAIVKGMNLEEGATTLERNRQIGGHKA